MKNPRQHLPGFYMWLVVAAGAASCVYAGLNFPAGRIDFYFLLLTIITAIIGSRVAIRIPQINVNITVDDTFVFIALLMYGLQPAVLLGAMAGICSGLRISKRVRTVAFGGGALAMCSSGDRDQCSGLSSAPLPNSSTETHPSRSSVSA